MGIIIYRLTGGSTDVITWCDDHLTIATPLAARVSSGLVIEILDYLPDSSIPADHNYPDVRREWLYARVELWQRHLHHRARAQWELVDKLDGSTAGGVVTLAPDAASS